MAISRRLSSLPELLELWRPVPYPFPKRPGTPLCRRKRHQWTTLRVLSSAPARCQLSEESVPSHADQPSSPLPKQHQSLSSQSGPNQPFTQLTDLPAENPLPLRNETTGKGTPVVVEGKLFVSVSGKTSPISGRWMRSVCACPKCRNSATGQRQVNVFRLSKTAYTVKSVECGRDNVTVRFADGHQVLLPNAAFAHRSNAEGEFLREGILTPALWDAGIAKAPPVVKYELLEDGPPGLAQLLRLIRTHGFAFVEDVPPTPEATKAILERIGPIRNTHYGGFYDFTSDLSLKDTAYTSEALEPHTDNTYFTEPAGLQALHLLSHTDGSGGESVLVDGFNAARMLYRDDRNAYHVLSKLGVHAHASGNQGISIQPAHPFPVFSHSPSHHRLIQVRWNNADRAGVSASWDALDSWYAAAAKFDALVNDRRSQYWFQLQPGRMLLFDNWRVLHGRSAFTGKRRMCGGYINRDDWVSKFRMLNLTEEEIAMSTVNA